MAPTSCRRLAEAVCIVTGGGRGIGRTIVRRLAAESARVVVLDSDVEGGRDAERAINGGDSPGEAKFVRASVTDEAAVKGVMHAVADEWGGIDGLVTTVTETREGASHCAKHAAPIMADGGGGIVDVVTIPETDSTAATTETRANTADEGPERDLRGFARRSAIEFSGAGIRVNSISLTRLSGAETRRRSSDDGPERASDAEAVAAAAAYLLSDEAAFVTGADVPIDATGSR